MTDVNTNCDPDALNTAIIAGIREKFPDLETVEFYRDERRPVIAPACLLEMSEFEPGEPYADAGTGQLVVDMTFEARLILGFKTNEAKQSIRKLATAFAQFVHLKRWPGARTGPGQFVSAYPDSFSPAQDQYEVWLVTWTQKVFLGETVWTSGTRPTSVWLQMRVNGEKDGDPIQVADE